MAERYPLEDLLRVRLFREDNAASEMSRRRTELESARALVVQRSKELEEYVEWRIRREEELYEEIIHKEVKLRSLDDLKQDIQLLREKQLVYEEKVREAERGVKDAEDALEQAHAAYLETVKDRQKIDEHKEIWAKETMKAAEADQEKEMEDFRVRAQET